MQSVIVCGVCDQVVNGTFVTCTRCLKLRICAYCYIDDDKAVQHTCTGKIILGKTG